VAYEQTVVASGYRSISELLDAGCKPWSKPLAIVVDAWEFDNEPDLMFVNENPETYGAFLKACALGVAQAREARRREEAGNGEWGKGEIGRG
jgi:hypothetical protein